MNTKSFSIMAALVFMAATAARADAVQKPAPATPATNAVSGGGTNGVPSEAPIPVSTFEMTPASRDPFFPNSTRLASMAASTNSAPAFNLSSFTLKALSGPAGKRLAMINNRTFAVGEKCEITTPSGKMMVYCDDIKEESVFIHTDSQATPIEIFLRKNAR